MHVDWDKLPQVLDAGLHTLLYGSLTGTGKTTIAGRKLSYALTLTPDTPASEIRGHYIPEGSKFVFHDGPGIRAWREGCGLVLNEIDQASGDVQTLLYALLDDPSVARLTLPTGETVRPTPGFQAIATMNGRPEDLPPALLDRFAVRIEVDTHNPAALARLSTSMRQLVVQTQKEDAERRVTLRQALAFEQLRHTLQDARLAANAVFGVRGNEIHTAYALNLKDAPREVVKDVATSAA